MPINLVRKIKWNANFFRNINIFLVCFHDAQNKENKTKGSELPYYYRVVQLACEIPFHSVKKFKPTDLFNILIAIILISKYFILIL